jgi:DNA-binding MarR family transcriptional regulator
MPKKPTFRLLDVDNYVPFFLTVISNKLSRGASRLYLQRFGVGVVEWRVMAMLAIYPGSTAKRVCEVIGLDKAPASRTLHTLHAGGLTQTADENSRAWSLSLAGKTLHDKILLLALQRERSLLVDFTADEKALLLTLLRRMMARLPDLNRDVSGDV